MSRFECLSRVGLSRVVGLSLCKELLRVVALSRGSKFPFTWYLTAGLSRFECLSRVGLSRVVGLSPCQELSRVVVLSRGSKLPLTWYLAAGLSRFECLSRVGVSRVVGLSPCKVLSRVWLSRVGEFHLMPCVFILWNLLSLLFIFSFCQSNMCGVLSALL